MAIITDILTWFRRFKIYAIIESGGKQYKVIPGQTIEVDRLEVTEGNTVELDRVLLISGDDKLIVGNPTIEGAKVIATSQGNGRSKKIIVFKYKPKIRYRRKKGHRQHHTTLAIDKIVEPGAAPAEPVKKTRQRKKEVTTDGT